MYGKKQERAPYGVRKVMISFLADAMLGSLAKWLRILGYDTKYSPSWDDNELARIARAEGRVLLTRDTELSRRKGLRVLFIESEELAEQLAQVIQAFALSFDQAFSRCPVCNVQLEETSRSAAQGRVPPYTFETQEAFRVCPGCHRFYWRGTHWERMRDRIEMLARGGACR